MTNTQMTKVIFDQPGDADVLTMTQINMPEPRDGEVLIKVELIGMNFAESLHRREFYLYPPKQDSGLGYEAVGTVEAVGSGVTNTKVGDRMSTIPAFKMNDYGVYGTHAIVPAHAVAPYLDTLTAEENVAIWMSYVTAYGGLEYYGKIKAGDHVVITPASGGVGLAALQIANAKGATSIATTRSASKAQLLRDAGADHVIVTSREDFETALDRITDGKGIDLSFNAMTGEIIGQLARATAPGGTIIQYGGIGQLETALPTIDMITKGINIRGYTLFELTYDPAQIPAIIDYVKKGVEAGHFKPQIDRVFDFKVIQNAAAYVEAGDLNGKVIVEV